jgi:hypothetical protein
MITPKVIISCRRSDKKHRSIIFVLPQHAMAHLIKPHMLLRSERNSVRAIIARNIIPGHWIFQGGKKNEEKEKNIYQKKRCIRAKLSTVVHLSNI